MVAGEAMRAFLAGDLGRTQGATTSCCGRLAAAQQMARPDNWPRTILHVDLDAFYTSVHQRDDPQLRGLPVAVAGRSRRAVIMGASYEARAYGVRSAMPLHEALQLCPQLTVIAPDSARYREASRLVHQIFRRFTSPELVEGIALDEAYLDVTARTRHGTSNAEEVARRIKFQIHTEVGLTASVGAATSKLVAKVASGTRKPDGLVLVPPDTEADFLRSEEHTSELQSQSNLVCRLLLEKK